MSKSEDPTREANGQFRPGHCPNPKGRPKKTTVHLADMFDEVLAGSIDHGSQQITIEEALVRTLVMHAFKDPKVLVKTLELRSRLAASRPVTQAVTSADDHDTVQAFLEEQQRRARSTTPPDKQDDDDPEQD